MLKTALNRRGVLRFLGVAPVATPIAIKSATEKAVMDLSGLTINQETNYDDPDYYDPRGGITREHYAKALKIPGVRDLIIDQLRRDVYVNTLDFDIAAPKSISLAAKVCYQRQRNLENKINSYTEEYSGHIITNLIRKYLGIPKPEPPKRHGRGVSLRSISHGATN